MIHLCREFQSCIRDLKINTKLKYRFIVNMLKGAFKSLVNDKDYKIPKNKWSKLIFAEEKPEVKSFLSCLGFESIDGRWELENVYLFDKNFKTCMYYFMYQIENVDSLIVKSERDFSKEVIQSSVTCDIVQNDETPAVEIKQVNHSRCFKCNKKAGYLTFKCDCGYSFCEKHRLPFDHDCVKCRKKKNKKELKSRMVKLTGKKIEKI